MGHAGRLAFDHHQFVLLSLNCRLDNKDIAQHGGWQQPLGAMEKYYQDGTPMRTLLGQAGIASAAYERPDESYFAPRFEVPIDDDLKLQLMPFISQLRSMVERVCRHCLLASEN